MLNAASGVMATGRGRAPAGASQSSQARPSSAMRGRVGSGGGRRSCVLASVNSRRAPASRYIEARLSAVAEGASGATATPARSAPMNRAA